MRNTTALLVLVLLAGCASAPERVERSIVKLDGPASAALEGGAKVVAGARCGRGAIVGPRHVLTVAHVVGDAREVSVSTGGPFDVAARVVEWRPSWPEPLVLLELDVAEDGSFGELLGMGRIAPARVLAKGAGRAAVIVTPRGPVPCAPGARLVPGDSGSPVLDANGRLVGLLHGIEGGRTPVVVPLS